MNIVRLNFSHGTHEYHQSIVENTRKVQTRRPLRPIAIALDTKGPEIRTGVLESADGVWIEEGSELFLSVDKNDALKGNAELIFVDYEGLPECVKEESIVYIDDGQLALSVLECSAKGCKVRALNSFKLLHKKGVNLPNAIVNLPAMSEKDKSDLMFAVENDLDMIFASFIRKAEDVEAIRAHLGERGQHIRIISKIENRQGVDNFESILKVSDGIMVARGDLGIEIPLEKVFIAQKSMIAKCNLAGKPVICATQMLESMTKNPRPTRAEVSDVGNAVMDGSDCVMLSGETANGIYPVEATNIMSKICQEAETAVSYRIAFDEMRLAFLESTTGIQETIACSAVNASFDHKISAIIVLTTSGKSAQVLSKYHPKVPIITVTRDARVSRLLHLYKGCITMHYSGDRLPNWQEDVDKRIHFAMERAKYLEILKSGDHVVAIQGWKGGAGNTNSLRILPVE